MRELIETYWRAAQARDWEAFAATLSSDVIYDLPQTRERIRGRDAYVRFNAEYPGDWHVTIERIHADADAGVSWTSFTVDGETMPGIAFFTAGPDGLVATVTDFWPEPYDPPPGREHLVDRY